MTAAVLDDLDITAPCPTCRWYVIWIRRATAYTTRTRTFAHAHHHITRAADDAIGHRDRLRNDYRDHKNSHTTERGDAA